MNTTTAEMAHVEQKKMLRLLGKACRPRIYCKVPPPMPGLAGKQKLGAESAVRATAEMLGEWIQPNAGRMQRRACCG